jgi:hypothetical protein
MSNHYGDFKKPLFYGMHINEVEFDLYQVYSFPLYVDFLYYQKYFFYLDY